MDDKVRQQLEQEALAPILHEYRLGIETLIFAWLAETGHGLNEFEIRTKTENNIVRTWIEPKVKL